MAKRLAEKVLASGLSIRALERKAGWSQATLNQVLSGRVPLRFSHVAAVCKALGLPLAEFYRELAEDQGAGQPARRSRSRSAPSPVEAAAPGARTSRGPGAAEVPVVETPTAFRAERADRQVAEALSEAQEIWQALEPFPISRRRQIIERSLPTPRTWALAVRVCKASERAGSNRAEEALELAELALFIADRVPGPESWRSRLRGHCWATIANARRVAEDHSGAEDALQRAWELWRAGIPGEDRVLPEWRLPSIEASLRRDQRRFLEALALLDRALALADGDEDPSAAAIILLQKATVLGEVGDIEDALAVLMQAAPFVERSRDPLLQVVLRFNTAVDLWHLGRHAEAAELLPQIRQMTEQQGYDLGLLRVRWLEGRVTAGLGRTAEAIAALEEVRQEFTVRRHAYDAALASLDLAALYLEQGHTAEVRKLALAMAWIFKTKGIQREALGALKLFSDAAKQETATAELARRVVAEVERARR